MDCRTAQLLLALDRPHAPELAPEDRAQLMRHLSACPACHALERGEHALDEAFGKSMRAVPIPEGLERQLYGALDQQEKEQRQQWWRRAGRVAAVAASLLVLFGGVLWWNLSLRPVVDPTDLVEEFVHASVNPPPAEEIEERFRKQGVTVVVPPDLNYSYFVEARLAQFRNQTVPVLFFDNNGEDNRVRYARVFILRASQFNLQPLAERYAFPSGYRYRVEVRHRQGDLYAYVFVYTGDNLDWLRLPNST